MQSKGLSRVFSNTTVQNHQFFGAQPSLQSNSHKQLLENQKSKKPQKPVRTQLLPKGCEQRTEVKVVRMCEFDRRALAGLRCRQQERGELASSQKLWGWQS